MKMREPSRPPSGNSFGLVGTGRCGIGRRPSATASLPVSTAITPGTASAAAVSMRTDARVRVRRADELRVGLARQVEVVAVAPAAGDQPRVFLARHRLAEALAGGARAGGQERHRSAAGVRPRS